MPDESPCIILPLANPAILANETALSAISSVSTAPSPIIAFSTAVFAIVTAPFAASETSPETATDTISVPSPTNICPDVFAAKSVGAFEAPPTLTLPRVMFANLALVTASFANDASTSPVIAEPSPINPPEAVTSARSAFDPETITFFHSAILYKFYLFIIHM